MQRILKGIIVFVPLSFTKKKKKKKKHNRLFSFAQLFHFAVPLILSCHTVCFMLSPPFASQLHLFATCIPHGAFACHTRVFPATHTLPLNAFPCHMHVLTTCVLFPYTLPCHMYSLATPLPHYAYTHNFTFPMNSQTRGSWAPPLCFRGNFPSSVTSATFVNAHFPHSGLLLFSKALSSS